VKNSQQLSKQEHWKTLVDNWSSSGKSIRKWCLENSIPINTFRYWKDKFFSQKLDQKAFLEIVEEKSTNIVIRCKNFEIHIDKNFDEEMLGRCLMSMRSSLC
jgi:hypothetical protein